MDLKTEFTFDLQNEEFETIRQGIRAYNAQHLPDGEVKKIGCFVRNEEGNLVGGLTGDLFTNSVFVEFLWLDEHYRQHGLGSQLMQRLEHEVKPQGVTDICLDTYSFQRSIFISNWVLSRLDNIAITQQKASISTSCKKSFNH